MIKKKPEENRNSFDWKSGMIIFARMSGWVAGPVILAIFIGKWIDRKYETEPWGIMIAVLFFFVISSIGIVRESTREMKRIEEEERKK